MDELLIERYASEVSTPQDALLEELERATFLRAVHPQMLSGHLQGKLLEMLVRMIRPRSILEIGTFTGYSALCMAAGLDENATIDTIEADDELQPLVQSFFDRSPHGAKIRLHIGSALDIAPKLGRTYDMVFIDGDKKEYPAYLEMIMAGLVHPGSWILADNILWYGKAAEEPAAGDRQTKAIREFNHRVADDTRLENVIVPVRDGLNLIRVK
ncbi:MAG: O-methyltransferase [Rikenellaceae bacterium]|jgi:caffeoyl-CoA O-methyltransferase|nr:O-methyltransferase [Rikenellaceae bacterium]